jgi:hypothetical protein
MGWENLKYDSIDHSTAAAQDAMYEQLTYIWSKSCLYSPVCAMFIAFKGISAGLCLAIDSCHKHYFGFPITEPWPSAGFLTYSFQDLWET